MSSISSSLGQVLAPLVSATVQGSGTASREGAGNTATVGTLASQTAAVVTLSSNAKTRSASSGEGRQIDATFDKQEAGAKRTKEKEDDNSGKRSGSISVSA